MSLGPRVWPMGVKCTSTDFSIETEDKSNELSHSSLLTFRNNLINKLHKTMSID